MVKQNWMTKFWKQHESMAHTTNKELKLPKILQTLTMALFQLRIIFNHLPSYQEESSCQIK